MTHFARAGLALAVMMIGAGAARADFIGTMGLSSLQTTANSTDLATATSFTFAVGSLSNPAGTDQLSVSAASGDYTPIPAGVSGALVIANGPLDITGASLLSLTFTNGSQFTPPTASFGMFNETSIVFHTLSNPAPNTVRETVYVLGTFTPTATLLPGGPLTPLSTSIVFTFDQVGGTGGSLVGQGTLSTPPSAPEPSTIALLDVGGVFSLVMRRRMKSKA
jgi:hypothetical protein